MLARAICIDFQTVSFGIGEVQGLADPVIGGTSEWPAPCHEMREDTRQLRAIGQEDRRVVETRGPGRPRWCRGVPLEEEMRNRRTRRDCGQESVGTLDEVVSENASIEQADQLLIGDPQRDRPEPGVGWKRGSLHVVAPFGVARSLQS
ncbi:hypothetical protein HRbin27_01067 [bacterium HR27]|nr:hypothetical protein HRbin27_01067 [bacterium HR27]